MFINFAKDQTDLLDDELPVQGSSKKKSSFKKSEYGRQVVLDALMKEILKFLFKKKTSLMYTLDCVN